MNDAAFIVEIVETEEDLFSDLLDDRLWNTSMLISFDQAEQVFAEDSKTMQTWLPLGPL
jgi:hypothetical protein